MVEDMTEQTLWLAIVVGILISIFLFVVILKTWRKLQIIETAKKEYQAEVAEKQQKTVTSSSTASESTDGCGSTPSSTPAAVVDAPGSTPGSKQ